MIAAVPGYGLALPRARGVRVAIRWRGEQSRGIAGSVPRQL